MLPQHLEGQQGIRASCRNTAMNANTRFTQRFARFTGLLKFHIPSITDHWSDHPAQVSRCKTQVVDSFLHDLLILGLVTLHECNSIQLLNSIVTRCDNVQCTINVYNVQSMCVQCTIKNQEVKAKLWLWLRRIRMKTNINKSRVRICFSSQAITGCLRRPTSCRWHDSDLSSEWSLVWQHQRGTAWGWLATTKIKTRSWQLTASCFLVFLNLPESKTWWQQIIGSL